MDSIFDADFQYDISLKSNPRFFIESGGILEYIGLY